ncbi:UPF0223 family protein [Cytobacillus depressus]|uniref:UPF0223 protein F7731_07035 n=1 Tax=Cytobacillus depressus TaxID=1602942 RepID=A0A6L3V9U0_9BACI|nr:UPF0223 family protein [Cytobacillus depressus]KAB2337359.1 UPF0223 family protein [Cytobacillus depressus]
MEYQYPIDPDWSTEEIIDVIHYFQQVEEAYGKGVNREQFLNAYRRFKEIVPGKAQERNICNEFEEVSGFSAYRTLKMVKELETGLVVKMRK